MLNYQMIKKRQMRLSMPIVNCSNINTTQKLNESTAIKNLSKFVTNKIDKPSSKYVGMILEFARNTSSTMETTVINTIVNGVLPGVEDLNAFKESIDFETMEDDNKKLLAEAINDYNICDRILNNNERLSKRFNINKIIREATDMNSCIHTLCEMIDTYDMPIYSKFNVALENITYSMQSNGVDISTSSILENITDYFLLNEHRLSDRTFDKMKKIMTNNVMISEADIKNSYMAIALLEGGGIYEKKIKVLASRASNEDVSNAILSVNGICSEKDAQESIATIGSLCTAKHSEIPDDDKSLLFGALNLINNVSGVSNEFINIEINKNVNVPGSNYGMIIPAEISDDDINLSTIDLTFKEMTTEQLAKHVFTEEVNDNDDLKKLLADFKVDQDKNEPKLRRLITKFYSKSPEAIIDELPSIFSIIRVGYVAALIPIPYIGPVLALLTALINWFLKKSIRDKEAQKLLTYLRNERDKVDKKLDDISDEKEKQRYKAYRDEIAKSITKVEAYADDIDGENHSDAKIGFDDDFDFDFDEAAAIVSDLAIVSESLVKDEYSILSEIEKKQALNAVSENNYIDNYFISRTNTLNTTKEELRSIAEMLITEDVETFRSFMDIMYKSSIAESAEDILQDLYYDNYHKNYMITTEASLLWQKENKQYSGDITLENVITMGYCNNTIKAILESGRSLNNIKLLIQDAKRNIQKLSTKAKSAAMTANAYASGVVNSIEKSMTSDRREAIIKGRLLPSFTQMVKYAIVIAGAGVIFQPVAAVITAVGIFAVNKSLTYREKKMILDEIETELKVVEKQISIAENDGDMNQYRILLNMQKSLIRERQRIKYNMKAVGKNVPIPSVHAGRED